MKIAAQALNFIFPKMCMNCSAYLPPGGAVPFCPECLNKIKFIKPLFCRKCGIPLPDGGAHCYRCLHPEKKQYFDTIRSVCEYEGAVKRCVHLFKYRGKDYLSGYIGGSMAEHFRELSWYSAVDCVVAVPLHGFKEFVRGYNQALLLAGEISRLEGKPLVKGNLVRAKYTKPQAKLGRQERMLNVDDVFRVKEKEKFRKKTVLLVDDVCTTGETLNQCAHALRKAGSSAVHCLTFARDI